jgi:hypothetical protein
VGSDVAEEITIFFFGDEEIFEVPSIEEVLFNTTSFFLLTHPGFALIFIDLKESDEKVIFTLN